MKILGQSIIGFREAEVRQVASAGESFAATNPRTGELLPPSFFPSRPEEVDLAANLANKAFDVYSRASGREKGRLLRTIAARLIPLSTN